MPTQVLFLQGAGEGAYQADAKLAESLRSSLGSAYDVIYPALPHEDDPDDTWKSYIAKEIADRQSPVILVAHSLGGSMLLKLLSETRLQNEIAGIFLIATPFWGGEGWHYEGYEALMLPADLAAKLPPEAPLFLYHCQDDEVVPYRHLQLLQQLLPRATARTQQSGGHQYDNNLSAVAKDIRGL